MSRLLRIAAAAMAIVAVVALPYLWWWRMKTEEAVLYQDTYVHIDIASMIGLLIIAAAVVLILLAQARILERLDTLQGRSTRDY